MQLAQPLTSKIAGAASFTRIAVGTANMVFRNKIQAIGVPFYAIVFLGFPIFQLLMIALIYRENQTLRDYAVIAGAGTALIFSMLFAGGENMEQERTRGTLGNLFISPVPRVAWLFGFQLAAIFEALVSATIALAIEVATFGTVVSMDVPATIVTVLLLACMWGISMTLGANGPTIRNANQLSNMLSPIITPLPGTMFPIALVPDWLRIPARMLPFGYGMQALVDATTKHASIAEIRSDLLRLAGFAIVLPVLGMLAFRRLDVFVRIQGSLELV